MAATIASLGSAFTTTAGNKTVTATPTNGDLIVVIAVTTAATGGSSAVTDNATGGTYTQVGSTQSGFSTSGDLRMFVRNNLVTGAASTVYTATQTSSSGGGLQVLRITGMTLTGSAAVRSSGGQSTGTAGTTPAPVLSLTPLTSNPIITAVGSANTVAGSVLIQRATYTEDFDNVYSTPATAMEVAHLTSGETSATLTAGGTSTTQFASIAIELQFNSAPTTALNTPANTATGQSTTPTLNFTGTDADSDTVEYEVQVDTVNTFNSTPTATLLTSYSEVNADTNQGLNSGGFAGVGQSFIGDGNVLDSAKFYISKFNSPLGNITCKIYAHSGTFGTSSLPSGAALATSDAIDASTLSTSNALITFTFSGGNRITLTNATNYVITIEYNTTGGSNQVVVRYDASAATSAGNYSSLLDGGSWSATSTADLCFYVYTAQGGPLLDKLSTADAGFTAGHPFASGVAKDFTVQAGDTLTANTLYYWRVRAIDPSGTNTYGAYATTRSFTTLALSNIPNKIYSILQAVGRGSTY